MRKSDLKDRMVIEVDSGKRFMVVGDRAMAEDSYILLDDLDEDLRFTEEDNKGIQKVYGVIQIFDQKYIDDLLETLWERPWMPEIGDIYFKTNLSMHDLYSWHFWEDDYLDNKWYDRGLVFDTKEEAIEMAKKILKLTKEDI